MQEKIFPTKSGAVRNIQKSQVVFFKILVEEDPQVVSLYRSIPLDSGFENKTHSLAPGLRKLIIGNLGKLLPTIGGVFPLSPKSAAAAKPTEPPLSVLFAQECSFQNTKAILALFESPA